MTLPQLLERARLSIRTLGTEAPGDGSPTAVEREGRVLCVDDNEDLLRALVRQLGAHFDVVTASSGRRAIAVLEEEEPFDVIVCDLRMPGMHGLTFLNHARQAAPETERIILTGWADPTTMSVARSAAHANRLLTKPCPPRELREAVGDAMLRRRARQLRSELTHTWAVVR